jgi:hypothetical protein
MKTVAQQPDVLGGPAQEAGQIKLSSVAPPMRRLALGNDWVTQCRYAPMSR